MNITLRNSLLAGVLSMSAVFLLSPTAIRAAEDAKEKPVEKNDSATPRPYPLTTCIVTDNDLGSMGEETSMVYQGQVIKFCCAPCERKFLKKPEKYLSKLSPEKSEQAERP